MKKCVIIESNLIKNIIVLGDNDALPSGAIELIDSNMSIINSASNVSEFFPPLPAAVVPTMAQMIDAKIKSYQLVAPDLIRELYVENTMAGITTAQSDQMFDDFLDVLTRLKEGAFPTALYRLNQKTASGFVSQTLIDAWKAKIQAYL